MKKLVLISVVSLFCLNSYGQQINDNQSVGKDNLKCMKDPAMPRGAKFTWPSGRYISSQGPGCAPCYTYTSKHGTEIMECPFLTFLPVSADEQAALPHSDTQPVEGDMMDNISVERVGIFTGEYPKACMPYAGMPANAKPAWPKGPYTSLVAPSCAPCYTYTNKHGLEIMECPGLIFDNR